MGTSRSAHAEAVAGETQRSPVHLLERGRDAFQEQHGSLRAKHWIAPGDLLDLAHGLLDALDRGRRLPAEGTAPETARELPGNGPTL